MPTNRQLFLQQMAQTSGTPLLLEIEKAEGVYMYGPEGQRYIDLISGIGVSNVGHRHPKVTAAISAQLEKYLHLMVYGEVVQEPQLRLATAMQATLPADKLNSFYFLNSGSEAIEAAIKLVRKATGRNEIVTCVNAYHGSSTGALSASGNEFFKQNYRPLLPGFSHIRYNEPADFKHISCRTAAVFIETIQGEAGIQVPDAGYLEALKAHCEYVGALLVLDEIQAGAGRTGKVWAFQHYDFVPDVLIAAKGMGGGMPIGALITSKALMETFMDNPFLGHITTFGGHPLSCVAAAATFAVISDPQFLADVERKAQLFKSLLVHKAIKSIRNKGLMMAAEMESYAVLKPVIDKAIELGVLTDWFLFNDKSMRIAPPLVITDDEIKEACSLIIQAIETTLGK
jgi:acetylornithine/succinyldiaminopimelate/putrescine aminotransferase